MHSKTIRYGLLAALLSGTMMFSGERAFAADTKDNSSEVCELNREYLDMGFTHVEEGSFLYVRSQASKESEWVGKLYPDYAVRIKGPIGEWTKIESGMVSGYVKTEFILTGDKAQKRALELVEKSAVWGETAEIPKEIVFHYAEPRNRGEAVQETSALVNRTDGHAVVDFACSFIGNPYVWGGTSLTDGADCSGFVQSVYANFGISVPRTSWQQREAGVEVSYEEAQPGDVFCYDGHVGIYIGNGKIVNAIDEAHGIDISSAGYSSVITIRRFL